MSIRIRCIRDVSETHRHLGFALREKVAHVPRGENADTLREVVHTIEVIICPQTRHSSSSGSYDRIAETSAYVNRKLVRTRNDEERNDWVALGDGLSGAP